MKHILIFLVSIYQFTTRDIRGRRTSGCVFFPSCSEYAKEALTRRGARRGAWLALKRIARCRPRRECEFDPVA